MYYKIHVSLMIVNKLYKQPRIFHLNRFIMIEFEENSVLKWKKKKKILYQHKRWSRARKKMRSKKARGAFCNDRCFFGETSKRTIYKLFRSHYTFYGLPEGHANEFRWTSSVSSKCGAIVSCILDDFGTRTVSRSPRSIHSSVKTYLIH